MIQQFHSWIYIQDSRTGIQINICTQILIAVLITIAKMLKQSKHLSTEKESVSCILSIQWSTTQQ